MRRNLTPLIFLMLVGGCTTTSFGNVGGQPTISQPAQTVAPSTDLLKELNGGLIARLQGNNLNRVDRAAALQSEYRALEYTAPGEAVLWRGDRLSGQIIPSQPYRVGSQDCRQYEHVVTDQSVNSSIKGTACRNEDGSWSLLS